MSDEMLAAIQNGITETRGDGSAMVHSYVVLAAWVDEDGDQRLYCDTMDDQRGHVTLGLLDWAQTCERRRVADVFMEDE